MRGEESQFRENTYLDDVKGLVNRSLSIEGETGINLSRHLSWDNLQDLLSELNKETVKSGIDLVVNGAAVLLSVLDGGIDEGSVLLLLGGSEDERWVGGSVLWLVLGNGCEVTRVGDDGLM